jgi:hypothetical protein
LKNLLSGAKITSANLKLSSHSNLNGFDHSANIGVYPISKPWASDSATWSNQPSIESQVSNLNVTKENEYILHDKSC